MERLQLLCLPMAYNSKPPNDYIVVELLPGQRSGRGTNLRLLIRVSHSGIIRG